jgi:site-specific DNA recombinase
LVSGLGNRELVRVVNEELDSTHGILKDRLDTIDAELNDVRLRLSKLYDALETGKLSLHDLALRIKELKIRQDQLGKAKVQLEAEMAAQGATHVDADIVKSYAEDLKSLLKEADIAESKAFLRSFVKRVEIDKSQAVIHYNLPVPQCWSEKQSAGVLPIDTLGGAGGARTPYLLNAIQALSQMSYSPTTYMLL